MSEALSGGRSCPDFRPSKLKAREKPVCGHPTDVRVRTIRELKAPKEGRFEQTVPRKRASGRAERSVRTSEEAVGRLRSNLVEGNWSGRSRPAAQRVCPVAGL